MANLMWSVNTQMTQDCWIFLVLILSKKYHKVLLFLGSLKPIFIETIRKFSWVSFQHLFHLIILNSSSCVMHQISVDQPPLLCVVCTSVSPYATFTPASATRIQANTFYSFLGFHDQNSCVQASLCKFWVHFPALRSKREATELLTVKLVDQSGTLMW